MEKEKRKVKFLFGDEQMEMKGSGVRISKKECPFCRAENTKLIEIAKNQAYCIRCMNCLTMGPVAKTDLDAVKFWENGVYGEIGIKREDR